jgi:hypothetical protein
MLRVPGAIIRSTSLVRPTHRATPRICCRPFRLAVPHWFGPGSVSTPAPPHQLGIRQCESGRPSCDRDDPPATRFPYGVNRYCHRATRISGERPCSTKSNRPPGFRTRRISARAAIGCGIEQRVQVITIASKVRSSDQRDRDERFTARFLTRRSNSGDGSRPTTRATARPYRKSFRLPVTEPLALTTSTGRQKTGI